MVGDQWPDYGPTFPLADILARHAGAHKVDSGVPWIDRWERRIGDVEWVAVTYGRHKDGNHLSLTHYTEGGLRRVTYLEGEGRATDTGDTTPLMLDILLATAREVAETDWSKAGDRQ